MSLAEYTREGAVALIRLNRPPVNALSNALCAELEAMFTRAEDPEIRAIVVTGEPHFAVGADIKEFQQTYDAADSAEKGLAGVLSQVVRHLERLDKPTIAAVHGYALGGGLELAMGTDFRYFSEEAKVGQTEILLGIIPGAGGTQRLPRLVGFQKAKELNYTGRQVGAGEALAIGLADKVFPAAELLEASLAAAAELAQGPTVALAAARRAMNEGWGRDIDAGLEIETRAFQECFWSEDAKEGVAAFIEKRKANFKGR